MFGDKSLEEIASMRNEINGKPLPADITETTEFQDISITEGEDDAIKIRYEDIPDRRLIAKNKEIKMQKILTVLRESGYSQDQINEIFNNEPSPELFDSLVEEYDATHDEPPDTSYISFNN